MYTGHTSTVCL